MRINHGILLSAIVLAVLSGLLLPSSEAFELRQTTSGDKVVSRSSGGTITAPTVYSKEQEEKIKQNWSKLTKGMGFQEIDELVGPIGGTSAANESLKGHVDLANEFMSGSKSAPGTPGLIVENAYYTLEFLDGGLANWQLKTSGSLSNTGAAQSEKSATFPSYPKAKKKASDSTRKDEPVHAWRAANWGMSPEEVLAAFPNEAVRPNKQDGFGNTNLSILAVIPDYSFDGVPLKVSFGFDPEQKLQMIGMSKFFDKSATLQSAFETVLRRLKTEMGQPDETGEKLVIWKTPGGTIRLSKTIVGSSIYFINVSFKSTDLELSAVNPSPQLTTSNPDKGSGTVAEVEKTNQAIEKRPSEEFKDCDDCPVMVVIPAGSFEMGSNSSKSVESRPAHLVHIDTFALAKTHVTRRQFAAFINASGYKTSGICIKGYGNMLDVLSKRIDWQNPGFQQTDNDPVVCVSWNDAKAYVDWLSKKTGKSYQLPSEAQWEYASRAGATTDRYWGVSPDQACAYENVFDRTAKNELPDTSQWTNHNCSDGYAYTAPVGSFKPNAFGLYDMIGNAGQWVEDCYHDSYSGAPSNGSVWQDSKCEKRVKRGGSFDSIPMETSSTARFGSEPERRHNDVGFRPILMQQTSSGDSAAKPVKSATLPVNPAAKKTEGSDGVRKDGPMQKTNHAWRAANWDMTPEEVLAAFPSEAVRPNKPNSFSDLNLSILAVIPNYSFDDVQMKVEFCFDTEQKLQTIIMSATKKLVNSAAQQKTYDTVLRRLKTEMGKPDETGDKNENMFARWKSSGVTAHLYEVSVNKYSLYFVNLLIKPTDLDLNAATESNKAANPLAYKLGKSGFQSLKRDITAGKCSFSGIDIYKLEQLPSYKVADKLNCYSNGSYFIEVRGDELLSVKPYHGQSSGYEY